MSSRVSTLPTSLRGRAGQHLEAGGHLVGRQVLAAEGGQALGIGATLRRGHDERPRHLAEAIVGQAGDRHVDDVR